jgi:dTDP-4-amino-4,6-dideoxygalactose transaminase
MGLKHRVHPLAASLALDQLGQLDSYLDGRAKMATCLLEHLKTSPASGSRGSARHCAPPGTA